MQHTRFILSFAFLFGAISPVFSQNDSLARLQTAVASAKSASEKAKALNQVSDFQRAAGNLKPASEAAENARRIAEENGIGTEAADALDNLGQIFEAKFDYTNALKSYVAALKYRESAADQPAIARSKHRIGRVFLLQGDLDQAQINLEKALELRQNANDASALAETNRALGDFWREKKVFGKAQERYRLAIEGKIEAGDLPAAAATAGLLGKLSADLGDYEGALVYYRQSFDLNSGTENLQGMGHDLLNIGKALQQQDLADEALENCQRAAAIFRSVKDTVGMAQSLEYQANILASAHRPQAEAALEQAAALLAAIAPVPGVPEIYQGMAGIYRQTGNMAKAYEHLLRYTTAKEQVFGLEKNKAMLELTTRYESEFAAEEQKRTIQQLELQQASTQKLGLAVLVIMLLGVFALWALWRSNRQKRRDNQLLQSKNAEIDAKNQQLNEQNGRLDELNRRLVGEVASREMLEQNAFNRDQFVAVLSREMRAPMNEILAQTRALLADKPRPAQAEALLEVQFSANNLLVLLNDLLDYSKIEAGKITLESVEFEPKKSVAEIEKRFAPIFKEKDIPFSVELDPKTPSKIVGDPARFTQILNNILANTAQHANGGEVRLNIANAPETDGQINLSVKISATQAIFEADELRAMEQPNAVASLEGAPVLALVLAKKLAALQNGLFSMSSAAGKGTNFALTLPFEKGLKRQNTFALSPEERANALEGKYILVAEDNKINQLVVQKMLEKAGAVVVTADDGVAALDAFRAGQFDLILMDIQMPKLDGYRTVAEMRQSNEEAKKATPIIALTASAYLTDKEKAELFQMNDHIGKPFSPEELLAKVIMLVRQKDRRSQPKTVKV